MKLLSYNIRVWWRDLKRVPYTYWRNRMRAIREMIEQERPDILCLQEAWFPATLFIPKQYRRAGFSLGHKIYIRKGSPVRKVKHRWRLHYDFAVLKVQGYYYLSVASVHSHWKQSILERNCRNLMSKVAKFRTISSILVGDWNNPPCGVESYLDKSFSAKDAHGYSFENWDTGVRALLDIAYTRGLINAKAEYGDFVYNGALCSDHKPLILHFL